MQEAPRRYSTSLQILREAFGELLHQVSGGGLRALLVVQGIQALHATAFEQAATAQGAGIFFDRRDLDGKISHPNHIRHRGGLGLQGGLFLDLSGLAMG